MCGIVGTINIPLSKSTLEKIKHRGPDSMGLIEFESNNSKIYFGQTRLSIVDLSNAGFQPMTDKSGRYTILMNGEIYNHENLREKITQVNFKGHSDTETILYYFIQYGIDAISNLNGIFSIAFFDHEKGKLFLARDPFGIKPLYYYHIDDKLIFASEIRIFKDILKNIEVDEQCVYNYLRLRFCPSPLTLYKDILKLEPGHYLELDLTKNDFNKKKVFFSYIPKKNTNITFDQALDEYDQLVRAAIKRQLMSDVPIAIMLSGGIDSALLTHLAQEISGQKFDTFCIGFDFETGANELEDAAKTAHWLGSNHHEIIISQNDFTDNSGELIRMLEEPVGSQSLYPFYHLTDEILKKGFKVALSGQGVDEGMAGYNRYNFQNTFDRFSSPIWKSLKIIQPFLKNDKIRRGINAISETDRAARFIESYSFFDKKKLKTMLSAKELINEKNEDRLLKLLREKADLYDLNKKNGLDYMLMLDSRLALTDDLLLYTDKLSMQNSIEVRVPFLDINLMQFIESLPTSFKSSFTKNKILHKKLAERYLPDEIIYRKKKGFYIPRNEWYKTEVGTMLKEKILSEKGEFSKLINTKAVAKMFDDHKSNKYNYEDQIYSIMNLYYWYKQKNEI
jgi:asparagine synthase (glutamine-hydrolysing)